MTSFVFLQRSDHQGPRYKWRGVEHTKRCKGKVLSAVFLSTKLGGWITGCASHPTAVRTSFKVGRFEVTLHDPRRRTLSLHIVGDPLKPRNTVLPVLRKTQKNVLKIQF